MAGDKADIQQTPAQLDFWETLNGTRVVVTAAGTAFEPWRAPTRQEMAKAFGDAEATQKKRRNGLIPCDANRPRMVLAPAKFGNRTILRRRD